MSSILLSVQNAEVTYHSKTSGTHRAVKNVSFDVQEGEILGIVGESGCGKSSLARAIVGLNKLSAGSIKFLGSEVTPLPIKKRDGNLVPLQMVFQDPYASLNPRRSVFQQLREVCVAAGNARGERVGKTEIQREIGRVLEMVALDPELEHRFPRELSGGQRQRVAIAKALLTQPKIIVADEPIAALDASSQKYIGNLLRELVTILNIGLVIISHDLAVVATIADRTAVMRHGKFEELGSTEQVWTQPRSEYTLQLLRAVPSLVSR